MVEPQFYCIEYSSKRLYVAAGSRKALDEFNSMYFRGGPNIEDKIKVVDETEASQAPAFSDFERCRRLRRKDSFCLGVVQK